MVLQNIVDGLIVGSILVLGAIGLTLIYGIRRFPFFAHGEIITLGAYIALVFNGAFLTVIALPPEQLWLALLLATAVSMTLTALFGIFLEISIFKRMHGESLVRPLIASIGLAFVLQNGIRLIFGTSLRNYGLPAQIARVLPFGIRLTDNAIAILLSAFVLVLGVHIILKYTTLGKAMRATADNWDLARVTGIDVQRVIYATWVMGAGLAAAAGVLLGLWTIIRPLMGFTQLLPIFAAVILGGIGSPYGAMAGGLLIGVAQEVSVPFLFSLAEYKVALLPVALLLATLAGVAFLGWYLLRSIRDRRSLARVSLVFGGVFAVLAALLLVSFAFFQVDPNAPVAVFFELGLQQPAAFKPAIPFMILVLVLLLLPGGLVGLSDKPRFKVFIKVLSNLPKKAVATSRSFIGRKMTRSK
ncbi:MAG: branched-chain amino acid ABC transporter permease [Thermoplasmata archaeon]